VETHCFFFHLGKEFDRVSRENFLEISDKRAYPKHIINLLKTTHNGTKMKIEIDGG
jgi:hypothetical protein